MRTHRLVDLRQRGRLAHRALHRLGVHMVTPLQQSTRHSVGARINGAHRRRKDPLPSPAAVRMGVLHRQRMRQMHTAKTRLHVLFVQRPRLLQLLLQRTDQVFGQHGDAVFITFAFANHNLAPGKLHILDAQAQRLQQAHARAIQQPGNQPRGALHVHEQLTHLCRRQHHRQPLGGLGLHHLIQPRQLHLQHLFVGMSCITLASR